MNGLGNRHQIRAGQRLRIVKDTASPGDALPPTSAATEIQLAKVDPRPAPRS